MLSVSLVLLLTVGLDYIRAEDGESRESVYVTKSSSYWSRPT